MEQNGFPAISHCLFFAAGNFHLTLRLEASSLSSLRLATHYCHASAQGPVQMSEHRTKSMPITVFFWSMGNDLAGTKHMGDGCFRTSDFSVVFPQNPWWNSRNSECQTHLRLRQGFSLPLKCRSIASREQDLKIASNRRPGHAENEHSRQLVHENNSI